MYGDYLRFHLMEDSSENFIMASRKKYDFFRKNIICNFQMMTSARLVFRWNIFVAPCFPLIPSILSDNSVSVLKNWRKTLEAKRNSSKQQLIYQVVFDFITRFFLPTSKKLKTFSQNPLWRKFKLSKNNSLVNK